MLDKETKSAIENQIMTMVTVSLSKFDKPSTYIVADVLEDILKLRKVMDYCHENSLKIPDKVCSISYDWESSSQLTS